MNLSLAANYDLDLVPESARIHDDSRGFGNRQSTVDRVEHPGSILLGLHPGDITAGPQVSLGRPQMQLCRPLAVSLCGPPERIADRMGAWRDAGAGTLICGVDDIETVRMLADLGV